MLRLQFIQDRWDPDRGPGSKEPGVLLGGRLCTLARGGQVVPLVSGGPLRCGPPAHLCVDPYVAFDEMRCSTPARTCKDARRPSHFLEKRLRTFTFSSLIADAKVFGHTSVCPCFEVFSHTFWVYLEICGAHRLRCAPLGRGWSQVACPALPCPALPACLPANRNCIKAPPVKGPTRETGVPYDKAYFWLTFT